MTVCKTLRRLCMNRNEFVITGKQRVIRVARLSSIAPQVIQPLDFIVFSTILARANGLKNGNGIKTRPVKQTENSSNFTNRCEIFLRKLQCYSY